MIDCIVHDVPFPAYETFEDRQNLPRRFFLFFDKFFKAGRHNKELWNAALERNKGRNNISFGTCIFEAHVRTTIQENYFAWMYQALASPKIIQVLEKADDFKTEYDFDDLPNELACGCPFISDLPMSCEIRYNPTMKVFETVSSTSQVNAIWLGQKKRLQEIIDKTKEGRRETLKVLREMIDAVRPKYGNYNRDEKKEFNMEAKRTFKLFLDTDKENIVEGTTPPNKRQKRSSSQNKCRVTSEKLDVFKAVTNQMLQEKQSGLRSAWERIYKEVVNTFVVEDNNDNETHKPGDFLLELEELDNDWKMQSSSEYVRRESDDENGAVQRVDAV
jgi:hypothetical protein